MRRFKVKSYSSILLLLIIIMISMLIGCSSPLNTANNQEASQTQNPGLQMPAKPNINASLYAYTRNGATITFTDWGRCEFQNCWIPPYPHNYRSNLLIKKTSAPYSSSPETVGAADMYYPYVLSYGNKQADSSNTFDELSYQWDLIRVSVTYSSNPAGNYYYWLIKCVDPRLPAGDTYFLNIGTTNDYDGNEYPDGTIYLANMGNQNTLFYYIALYETYTGGYAPSSTYSNIKWAQLSGRTMYGRHYVQLQGACSAEATPSSGYAGPAWTSYLLNIENLYTGTGGLGLLQYNWYNNGWMGESSFWEIQWYSED